MMISRESNLAMRSVFFDSKSGLLCIEPLPASQVSMASNQIKNRKQSPHEYAPIYHHALRKKRQIVVVSYVEAFWNERFAMANLPSDARQ